MADALPGYGREMLLMAESIEIRFVLNGREVSLLADPARSLLHVLREDLDLTGTKQACDCEGECGACTVLLDGEAVRSCLTPIAKVQGRRVVTIEGLGTPERLHPVQQAFVDHGAVQCGFCTPGMILSAVALLDRELSPSREDIVEALAGNLCRCTGYLKIIEAVEAAAALMRGQAPAPRPEMAVIGGSQVRVDAVDKVTGMARYVEDIKMPGLLYAVLVRSPHYHAHVLSIDPAPALRQAGVLRVLTAADIPGANSLEGYSRDEPLLNWVGGTVRMVGDAIAIVLAESPELAGAGAAAVRVDYEPLPSVMDPVEAMAPGATPLYPQGNVLSSYEISYGNLEVAEADAGQAGGITFEAHYHTPYLEHSALERETVLSYWDGDGCLRVIGGHQEPHWARDRIARLLALPPEQVRVIVPPMGGAFGGKQDPWPLMAGALAAYHAPGGRPVRLVYSRRESFDASPKRHPYRMHYRVGTTSDGTLNALRLRIVANTGAYDADGYYVAQFGAVAGCGPYRWKAVDARTWSVYTNGPKSGQMRGFGTPQATFGLECALDELANQLGIDPLEFRLRNAIDNDTVTCLGYPVAETIGYRECLEAVRSRYQTALTTARAWNESGPARYRRGVGLAGMWYRFGKPGPITCEAEAELDLDGTLRCFCSAPDYGQGTSTVMAQLAAEALGVPRDGLCLVNADTALTPDSGIQGASRSTYWVGGAVAQAATQLRDLILGTAAEMLDEPPEALSLTEKVVIGSGGAVLPLCEIAGEMERIGQSRRVKGVFAPQLGPAFQRDSRPDFLPFFVTAVHMAEVEVCMDTGQVRILRVVAAHDVGRSINPQGVQGQIEGAVVMSMGAAMMEEYIPGVTTGFSNYYLPTIRCVPEIEVIAVEVPSRWGPQGAKGLGEAATLATAPAILNGIYHAAGARVRDLPATPERVLAAIHAARRGR